MVGALVMKEVAVETWVIVLARVGDVMVIVEILSGVVEVEVGVVMVTVGVRMAVGDSSGWRNGG